MHHTLKRNVIVIDKVPTATGDSNKMDSVYKVLNIITKVLDYDRSDVDDLPDARVNQRPYERILSADIEIEGSSWNDKISEKTDMSNAGIDEHQLSRESERRRERSSALVKYISK